MACLILNMACLVLTTAFCKILMKKEAILYDTCNNNNVKYEGTNMMSKVKAPFYSYKNPIIYYQNLSSNFFGNLYLGNETS